MKDGPFHICLITTGHLSTNPRLVKEADALADAGYAVSVVCTDFSVWGRKVDQSFENRNWQVSYTVRFGPYAPRLNRVSQIVRQQITMLIAGFGITAHTVVRGACHPAAPGLVRGANSIPADLYIAHYPGALPAAALAARRHHARYAYDAEDYHLGDWPDDPVHEPKRRLVRAIEQRHLPGCAYVTAASPGIADAYVDAYGIPRPTVILNVFPRGGGPAHATSAGTAMPGPSVYWFSQTIGPDRGLECAVRAVGQAYTRPHLYLRGTPAAGFLDRLNILAAEAGMTDRLHILSPEAPSEMVRLAASYDVGISGEPGHTANNRIALGNKLFTYFLAGLSAVMSDIPAHRVFARKARVAVRLFEAGNAGSLAAALDALLGDPAALATARVAAFDLAQTRFNWDVEQARLIETVRQVTAC